MSEDMIPEKENAAEETKREAVSGDAIPEKENAAEKMEQEAAEHVKNKGRKK